MTIFIVIIGISLLILIHEFGHFLIAKKMGLLVEEFGFGFPPRLFSKKLGETTYSLNLLPFGGFVKIFGEDSGGQIPEESKMRSFSHQPAWKRALIIVAGVLMNFLLGWFLMSIIFMIGTPKALLIAEVLPGSPAEIVGIMPQDQILGFEKAGDFIDFVNKNRGEEIALSINRGGEELSFKVIPRVEGEGAVGVSLVEAGVDKKPFLDAIWEGLKTAGFIVFAIFGAFLNLIWGFLTQGKVLVDFVGPIGIFGVASQAGSLGFLYLVQLIAMISLNLTVLNIFPFPALDGGRLLFVLIEKIKGSPLSQNFERTANTAGFILLLLAMIAITVRDITRLFL